MRSVVYSFVVHRLYKFNNLTYCSMTVGYSVDGGSFVYRKLTKVKLSSLCLWNFRNDRFVLGVEYLSHSRSRNYSKNPFQLKKFISIETGEVSYELSCVNELVYRDSVTGSLVSCLVGSSEYVRFRRIEYGRRIHSSVSSSK